MKSSGVSTVYRSFSDNWANDLGVTYVDGSDQDESLSLAMKAKADAMNTSSFKRCFDVSVSVSLLLILVPVFLLIAAAIKIESRGPVFFRQKRNGIEQRTFYIWKFRSMHVLEAEGSFRQAVHNDSRTTAVGRFLRATSLDELPQLFNVLRGDMSLVGPRPHPLPLDETFVDVIPSYADRYLVRPGITGLAQVKGFRGPTDAVKKIKSRVALDRLYIRRWSPWLDLVILFKTAWSFSGPNAV